uniref:Peptidase S8/S53 domain-containing protein n=1 Tax=Physcomitrium patens TaxID=3218 RepID=A0A7I4FL70_PHYPA
MQRCISSFSKTAQQQLMTASGASGYSMSVQHDLMLNNALGVANSAFKKLHDYTLFSGVAVDLTEAQATLLESSDVVHHVEKDKLMYISTTHTPEYMGLPAGAWAQTGGVGNAGEGIVIGVVDTGIYPDHPSFANDSVNLYAPHPTFKGTCGTDARVPAGFCNGKIIGARQFFEAAMVGANASDLDMLSPLDGHGHGTHCAGTAAGNYGVPVIVHGQDFGNASGIAPRARIAVYKALNKKGQGRTADIIAAINQAVEDGVHVLSLSLGPSSAPVGSVTFIDSFALACLGATRAGVHCVHAAGNTGSGPSTITSWSPWLTSVGATTTDRIYPSYLFTGDGRNYSGQGLSPQTPGLDFYPLIRASDAVATVSRLNRNFDCAEPGALNRALIEGKILVCSWNAIPGFTGSMSNYSRYAAQTTGAAGVVLLIGVEYLETNSPSSLNFDGFPAIAVTGPESYQQFLSYYDAAKQNGAAGGATGRLSGGNKAVYTGQPPKIASFSSRGPNVYLGLEEVSSTDQPIADVLKPNIVTHGVDIWAAWTPLPTTDKLLFRGQKWSMISGTSMAAPHIAGVSAIIKQMHPTWSPSAIASAISTSAVPKDTLGNPLVVYDYVYSSSGQIADLIKRPGNAFDFGNGFVDATTALNPGLIFDATYDDYIKFLCAERLLSSASVFAITSATCPPVPGLSSDLNLPSITIGNLTRSRLVPRVVTNVGPLETYTAVITQPPDVEVVVNPLTFIIAPGATQPLNITLTAVGNAIYVNQSSFGSIYLTGNLGHRVQVPVTVTYRQV